jgi:hypothetical protein
MYCWEFLSTEARLITNGPFYCIRGRVCVYGLLQISALVLCFSLQFHFSLQLCSTGQDNANRRWQLTGVTCQYFSDRQVVTAMSDQWTSLFEDRKGNGRSERMWAGATMAVSALSPFLSTAPKGPQHLSPLKLSLPLNYFLSLKSYLQNRHFLVKIEN